ncbi:hypothetical protein TIFTF001_038698 [Ficus carica]|uniref:Uncharacterized protein n=1 Tax=Ficus carica TaxID=3494 RepID=A0AA88JE66_FICCA|nr:hypothetical protein TIFTF001_038698 [Ficus carica]
MLVRLPTSYNDQDFLPMSFNEAGVNLHWHPKWEQTYFGHSNPKQDQVRWQASLPVTYRPVQGRVGLWIELEMDWPPQPLHSCAPGTVTYVSNLWATNDARWRSVAERL